jgi:uncharacterized repeat protein (TIGR01451 family)
LQPFETKSFTVQFLRNTPTVTKSVQIGDIMKFSLEIHAITIGGTPEDNVFEFCVTARGSYDSNDIICLEGENILEEKVGEYVHYIIRFENIGTVDAVNVVVKYVIDTNKFDVLSFIPINASHDFITTIGDDNIVEFIFENIQLPFGDANIDGDAVFKIKTLETLQIGNTF